MKLNDWQMDVLARVLLPKVKARIEVAPSKPHLWSRKPKPPTVDRDALLAALQTVILETVNVMEGDVTLEQLVTWTEAK